MERKEVEEDEELAEARRRLLKLGEVTSFARQVLRTSFGLNPLSMRERVLLRFENLKNQKNPQGEIQFQPLLQRRPLIERLKALRSQFQEEPKSEEDRIIEEYLREEKKKEILKKIKAQKEAEEKEKKRRELERIKREMAVIP